MTQEKRWVWTSLDPRPLPLEEGRISPLDRGYLYGDAIYETLRTYHARPFALSDHMERLSRGAERIGFPAVPVETIESALHSLAALRAPEESYLRVTVSRGFQFPGWGYSPADGPGWAAFCGPLAPHAPPVYERGILCIVSSRPRWNPGAYIPAVKFASNHELALAKREAEKAGAYEAIMLNSKGQVAEGTSSNVFFFRGKRLVTPYLKAGILDGVTRGILLRLAECDELAVEERDVSLHELLGAEEVFLASTLKEVVPVVKIGAQPIGLERPGPITDRLLGLYQSFALESTIPS